MQINKFISKFIFVLLHKYYNDVNDKQSLEKILKTLSSFASFFLHPQQQPHRSVKESNVNTVLGSSLHQRAKSPIPKSLTTSQVNETTSLDKNKEIIAQTFGTSSNPASDEQQRSTKRPRQQDQPDNTLSGNNNTSSSSTSSPRDHDQEDASTLVTNPIMITTARRTNHCAIAPYDYVKGKYMCIFFLDEKDLLDAIKLPITKSSKASPPVTENPNNNTTPEDHPDQPNPDLDTPPQFYFQKFSDAVPADDPNVKDDTNQRTVQVIDIPLGMKAHTVRASLSRYGDIESIKLVTRGLFQHAFIVYKSAISAITFVTYWGTYILRNAVRIFPKFLTNEQRQLRKNFGCKLTGLPNNIQARDLHDILRAMNAKSIFIPRNPVSYKPLNFAYINYESEDAKQKAMKTNYKLNGRDLFWCTENARTCNRCGSPSHLFNDCPVRKQDSKKQRLNKLYNRYRPAQHRKPRSYAEAARSNNTDKSRDHNPSAKNGNNSHRQDKRQQACATFSSSNLNGGTQQGGSIHGAQAEKFTAMYNEVLKLMEQINSRLSSIDKKIFLLEKRTSKQPEFLSPHARELREKNNSNIPSASDSVIENTASSSSSLTESQENPVDIEALKKESSETRSLTNTCVNILKQMQSYMGMDNPDDDADPENFENYDRDGDEDENMDEDEFDEEGYLLNPTDDALNKLTENWGN
ncbi:hypothetical protein C1645_832001 [Glomus cerebriforme]|uniref:CCHC-type domain-containing protein n=1 Tax=Glomus cerebriforme TaxID=658196 RepID=A0A397SGF0_9GLOM|nr:hypothetical protein C1645_832001 [Glomus cerebriforme]